MCCGSNATVFHQNRSERRPSFLTSAVKTEALEVKDHCRPQQITAHSADNSRNRPWLISAQRLRDKKAPLVIADTMKASSHRNRSAIRAQFLSTASPELQ